MISDFVKLRKFSILGAKGFQIDHRVYKSGHSAARFAAVKRGVTRLRQLIHDVRAMSACVPTADVSLHNPPAQAQSAVVQNLSPGCGKELVERRGGR
jgi:hypothetical protein